MESRPSETALLRFGEFEFNPETGELWRGDLRVKLPPQPTKLLALLASRPGQLITRGELQRQLWDGHTAVDFEHGLNSCIKQIRLALGDDAESPRYVETLPRRGYRFIYPLEKPEPAPSSQTPVEGQRVKRLLVPAAVTVVALGLLVGLNMGGLRERLFGTAGPPPIDSIAVLPLENRSGDPEQDYFADGMTDELIAQLAQISALKVISRTSVMQYKGARKPLPEIARELDVDAVIEGSVRWSGNHVRITAQLIHAPTDTHLWADSFEGDLRDVLAVQSEVARAIVTQVRVSVTPEERERLARTRPVNPEAYRLYLQGRYHWNRRLGGFQKAAELIQQAIDLDPTYALAYSALGDNYVVQPPYGTLSPREAYPRARAAAERALEIDSSLGEPYATLGHVLAVYAWDWDGAERAYRRALELNPNYATAHQWYAEYLSSVGRHEEAIAEIKRARELDPLSLVIATNVATMYYAARQYRKAEEAARKALELDPSRDSGHTQLGYICLATGRPEEALAHFEREQEKIWPILSGNRALAYVRLGKREEAGQLVEQLKKESKERYVPASWIGIMYAHLGDEDQAFHWLEKSLQRREWRATRMKVSPDFDPIRDDPRFQDLLRRMNFPEN